MYEAVSSQGRFGVLDRVEREFSERVGDDPVEVYRPPETSQGFISVIRYLLYVELGLESCHRDYELRVFTVIYVPIIHFHPVFLQ